MTEATADQQTQASQVQADQQPPVLPPLQSDAWKVQQEQNLFNLYTAEKAMMLDKQMRQQERVFATANFAISGNPADAIVNDKGGDEVGVSVGNTTNHYYTQQDASVSNTQQPAATNAATAATTAPTSKLPSWFLPAALLVGSGLMGGGGAMLANFVTKAPAAVQQVIGDTDTDTNSSIELGK